MLVQLCHSHSHAELLLHPVDRLRYQIQWDWQVIVQVIIQVIVQIIVLCLNEEQSAVRSMN
ncbi:hypothetical protein [Egbenema bharatensis]|uniref:hypothetical protein n=1 Tax=Egbenema bharatensis TaxID=3463334 RepID=UPI003A8B2954